MSVRWRVYQIDGAMPWAAQQKGVFKSWRRFPSWREAFDYADRQARQ